MSYQGTEPKHTRKIDRVRTFLAYEIAIFPTLELVSLASRFIKKQLLIMVRNHSLLSFAALTCSLSLELALVAGFSTPSLAQFSPPDRGTPLTADGGAARFSPPDRGAPESADGGATRRGECIHITPLIPRDNIDEYYGLTADGRPNLYWYVGSAKTGLDNATLVIEQDTPDGGIATIRETQVDLPDSLADRPQVLRWSWPSEEDALSEGLYRWYLEIQCNPDNPSDPTTKLVMGGWIERSNPSSEVTAALENTTDPVEQALIYGEEGFWFDYTARLLTVPGAWNYLLQGFRTISETSAATVDDTEPMAEVEFLPVVNLQSSETETSIEVEAVTQP
ncbi:MAG: DUF928 domain-containing protein [Cyanobacteria bacterium SBC]|nr:DUF928 domain-containing protein [Cyanobacteria bacterium SBC]